MKDFKKIFLGVVSGSAVLMNLSAWAVQSYAQSNESAKTSETVIISEVPGRANWEYPAESGPWPKHLDLSNEQLEQLVSLKSDYAINTAKDKAELKADTKKMILLMTAPTLDKQAVFALNERIDSLKVNLSDARVNQMLKVMNVMTAKQREEMRHHMLTRSLSHGHSMEGRSHKGYHKGHSA